MANVQHASLTGADLHEPKGADAASANTVYIADGAGSGSWAKIDGDNVDTTSDLVIDTVTAASVRLTGTSGTSFANIAILFGSGSPEGVVTAPIGSLYLNTSGGASTTLYVKTSGAGSTGWTAK